MTGLFGLAFSLVLPIVAGIKGMGIRWAFISAALASIPLIWKTNFLRELRHKLAGRPSNITYWIFALPVAFALTTLVIGCLNAALYGAAFWIAH